MKTGGNFLVSFDNKLTDWLRDTKHGVETYLKDGCFQQLLYEVLNLFQHYPNSSWICSRTQLRIRWWLMISNSSLSQDNILLISLHKEHQCLSSISCDVWCIFTKHVWFTQDKTTRLRCFSSWGKCSTNLDKKNSVVAYMYFIKRKNLLRRMKRRTRRRRSTSLHLWTNKHIYVFYCYNL